VLAFGAVARAAAPCGTVIVPGGVGLDAIAAPISTMDPVLQTGSLYQSEAIELLYRPLVWVASDYTIDPKNSLAASITPNAARTRFTVVLRAWHWSDGTRVTAADVLYDWHIIKELGAAYFSYGSGGVPLLIRDVRATSADTLVFDMTQPVNPQWFELAGLSQFYPLPRQAWGHYSIAEQQTLQSEASFYKVVDGPYRLASLTLGRNAVFVPNERYDGHKSSIARFVIDFMGGSDPIEALQAGEIDIASVPFDLLPAMHRFKDLRQVTLGEAPTLATLLPNLADPHAPFLADMRVRQAIAHAIDQRRIIDIVYHGHALIQHGYIPSAMTRFLAPALRDGTSPLGYDPAAARALLDAAGYHTGPDGIRSGHGHRLAFTVLASAGAESGLLFLQLVQADLAKVGIALDIKEVEFNQLLARMLGPPEGWDATWMAWSILTYPDAAQWFASDSAGNYTHYRSKEMDRLLAAVAGSADPAALERLQMFVLEQQPMIFLPEGTLTELVVPGLEHVDEFLSPNGNWTPEYLTLSGPRACKAHDG